MSIYSSNLLQRHYQCRIIPWQYSTQLAPKLVLWYNYFWKNWNFLLNFFVKIRFCAPLTFSNAQKLMFTRFMDDLESSFNKVFCPNNFKKILKLVLEIDLMAFCFTNCAKFFRKRQMSVSFNWIFTKLLTHPFKNSTWKL